MVARARTRAACPVSASPPARACSPATGTRYFCSSVGRERSASLMQLNRAIRCAPCLGFLAARASHLLPLWRVAAGPRGTAEAHGCHMILCLDVPLANKLRGGAATLGGARGVRRWRMIWPCASPPRSRRSRGRLLRSRRRCVFSSRVVACFDPLPPPPPPAASAAAPGVLLRDDGGVDAVGDTGGAINGSFAVRGDGPLPMRRPSTLLARRPR